MTEKDNEIEEVEVEQEPDDEQIVYFGGAVKALGDGKLGGYLVQFSSDDDPDLTNEFFTKETDYGDATKTTVYFNHGLDPIVRKKKLDHAPIKMDDFGVWIEAQIDMRDKYEAFIYKRAKEGKMGWSSGTLPNLVEREKSGKAIWIKSWSLGLDASITPTPAEPRSVAQPLKSINIKPLTISDPMDDLADEANQDGEPIQDVDDKSNLKESNLEVETMEITEERLTEIIDGAVDAGVEKAMKALPAVKDDVKVTEFVDEADQPFESTGHYFQAVKNAAYYPAQQDVRLLPLKATGLSENVPADGGYLLAPQVAGGIIERMYQNGQILSRVSSDPIGPNSNSMLYNAIDETSRVDGSRWGGLLGYWLEEAGTKTKSKPAFRQMELKLKKVAALCYATDELLGDAVALESWLARTVPEELRFQVENAIYNGNGVGKPLGIMNSPCLLSILRIGANLIDEVDIANMWSRRWAGVNDYVWLANSTTFPQLINLTLGNFPIVMQLPGGLQNDPTFSIYGRPFIEVEYAAALGTTGDIMLASLSQYQTIVKGGVQAASSIHVQFLTDETVYRFVYRTDGEPLWNSALTPYAGSTLSPFVVLTAASV